VMGKQQHLSAAYIALCLGSLTHRTDSAFEYLKHLT